MRAVIALSTLIAAFAAAASSGAAPGSPPSACAVAWNRDAPAPLRAGVASRHARGAFITNDTSVHTFTWTKSGSTHTTGGRGCAIQFILRDGHLLAVWGAWTDGRIPKWSGPVRSARAVRVPDNTAVGADGTVGFHG